MLVETEPNAMLEEREMSEHVSDLNDAQAREAVREGVTLVDFWAPWCGPCQMQGPILEQVAEQAGPGVTIGKVNVDQHQSLAAELGVQGIPALFLFMDGEVAQRFVGVQPAETLAAAIEAASAASVT